MDSRHLSEVFTLIDRENWGWDLDEIERIHAMDPESSVVALDGDEVAALVTCVNYGKLAFVVHVVVREGRRGKHLGHRMMSTVLEDLDSRGVATVELHANPEATDFYGQFGFVRVEDITYYSLSPAGVSRPGSMRPAPVQRFSWLGRDDIHRMAEAAHVSVGAGLEECAQALKRDPPHQSLAVLEEGRATALLLSRAGREANSTGPWVFHGPSASEAEAMMREALMHLPPRRTDVCVPSSNALAREALESCGFEMVKDGIVRLSRSSAPPVPYPRSLLAVGHFGLV